MFKVTDHEMVPKHEVLTPQERKEVLETLGVEKEQLPVIKETDPVIKEIGAKRGDVLRIIRKSQTAGHSVYYRRVVEG
ncbi:MAG: DNA-directed RNA polymerase subunit H [Candidatus Aenigmatarchaeota archaeon]|nr:MAG: DNA-directed RNA polymerase subunit H [Candidatus Aenigmarchaeota archaeon]